MIKGLASGSVFIKLVRMDEIKKKEKFVCTKGDKFAESSQDNES